MILRAADSDDWERAWAIMHEAFLDLVTRTQGGWTDDLIRECAAAWNPARTRMIVEDEVVGWVRVERHADHDWLDLIVLARRGAGLGTRVMRQLLREAEARGVPLWLSVYRVNPARRLYARLGFAELPRDPVRVFMVHPASTPLVPPR